MIKTFPLTNNLGKSTCCTWGDKNKIALVLLGCVAPVYALVKVMMEEL